MERAPLTKAAQLAGLDLGEMIDGYNDGRRGEPEPGDNRSLAYWRGWRNGAVDGKHRELDAAQASLAHDLVTARKAA